MHLNTLLFVVKKMILKIVYIDYILSNKYI